MGSFLNGLFRIVKPVFLSVTKDLGRETLRTETRMRDIAEKIVVFAEGHIKTRD